MELDKVFGLPAHPLLVHMPIILIPMLTLWVIALAIKPQWRDRLAMHTAAVGVFVMLATIAAAGAGEKFQLRVGDTKLVQDHADLGNQTKVIMIVFALILVGLAVAVRRSLTQFVKPLVILAAVAGLVTTVWVVRTGHAGAKAVWQETGKLAPRADGG